MQWEAMPLKMLLPPHMGDDLETASIMQSRSASSACLKSTTMQSPAEAAGLHGRLSRMKTAEAAHYNVSFPIENALGKLDLFSIPPALLLEVVANFRSALAYLNLWNVSYWYQNTIPNLLRSICDQLFITGNRLSSVFVFDKLQVIVITHYALNLDDNTLIRRKHISFFTRGLLMHGTCGPCMQI